VYWILSHKQNIEKNERKIITVLSKLHFLISLYFIKKYGMKNNIMLLMIRPEACTLSVERYENPFIIRI
jgi:hypothetical protein